MVSILGPPPPEFIRRSDITKRVFDEEGWPHSTRSQNSIDEIILGNWKGDEGVDVPKTSLEEAVSTVGPEDGQLFIAFIRKMLHWLPEQRLQPSELLKDPWLAVDL